MGVGTHSRTFVGTLDEILLTLYRSAMDVVPAEFPQFALGLVQASVAFDSGGRSTLDMQSGDPILVSADVFQERTRLMAEWDSVKHVDPVLARALSQPGQSVSFHAKSVEAATSDVRLRGYLRHNDHHQNGLVVVAPGAGAGIWDALGFYRSDADQQFSRRDMQLVDLLAPHLHQAIKINRALPGAVTPAAQPASAIARLNGELQFSAPAFKALLELEWPDWRANTLPAELIDGLRTGAALAYSGRHIVVQGSVSAELIVLQGRLQSPLRFLSEREKQAVMLFGAGKSTKEIARSLDVTHSTVRNFVQRAYKKLGVTDKAELAVLISTWAALG